MKSNILTAVLFCSLIGIFANILGQDKVKIKIIENGKVITDTIFTGNFTNSETDSIVNEFSETDNNSEITELETEVEILSEDNTNELDSLLALAGNNKNIKITVSEIENGTSFENKEKHSVIEFKVTTTENINDGEKTIEIEKEIIKQN